MRCQHPLSSSCTSEHCIPDQACPLHGCSPSSPSHTSGYRLSCCCRLLQSSHQLKPAKQMSACLMPMLTINPGSVCHRLKQQLSQHLLPDQQLILPQQACFSLPKVSSKWSLWRLPALRLPGWTYLQLKGRDQPALCQHPPGDLCRSACQQKDVNGAKMPWHTKAAAVRQSSTQKTLLHVRRAHHHPVQQPDTLPVCRPWHRAAPAAPRPADAPQRRRSASPLQAITPEHGRQVQACKRPRLTPVEQIDLSSASPQQQQQRQQQSLSQNEPRSEQVHFK